MTYLYSAKPPSKCGNTSMHSYIYLRLFSQRVGSRATVQKKHEPQDVCVHVIRLPSRRSWPIESRLEPGPKTTILPTISCPTITGRSTFRAKAPRERWTSVPQIDQVST